LVDDSIPPPLHPPPGSKFKISASQIQKERTSAITIDWANPRTKADDVGAVEGAALGEDVDVGGIDAGASAGTGPGATEEAVPLSTCCA